MSPRRPASSASGLLSSPPPSVAVEITATRVTAVSLAEQGGTRVVSAYANAQLPVGAVEPALNTVNVHNTAALAAAIKGVVDKTAPRVRRIALVLPDIVAKVSLIRFEKVPARAQDLEQLIQWQVRKAAPFRIEDAQVAWQPGIDVAGAGREYVVTVARRDIIQSYERACEAAGVHAGLIDLATFNVMNAMLAAFGSQSQGDWLLVHVARDYWTLVVVRGGTLVFFRNRASSGDADLADLVHQTAMYHEDRLGGGGFSRVVLAGASAQGAEPAERLRRTLEERIGARVEPIDFRAAASMRDRIGAGPELLDALTPSMGILLRERVA
ncbi:MAG: pilus assembly protein PilM [Acidobacteria bacterium]|nr:pilus assembly protein PilM [Acidobacteriota bacterium]MCA1649678.1 pilus assembly protein PilM [Acidobacteriota bacterium]